MKNKNNRGVIGVIVLVIIGIAVLSYLSVDIRGVLESDIFGNNISYIWGLVKIVWQDYLSVPAKWVWNNILYPYIVVPITDMAGDNATSTPPM